MSGGSFIRSTDPLSYFEDEKAGIAYVGREQEYQQYQQLAIQQQIAQDQYMAAQMQADAAWQWYGAWGPRAFWW
jgi:hypothetical protein